MSTEWAEPLHFDEAEYEAQWLEAQAEQAAREHAEQSERDRLEDYRSQKLVYSRDILKRRYPQQRYLIGPAILPSKGKLLITAETGVGKSVVALHIAACLATGTPLFGMTSRKHDEDFGKPVFPVNSRNFVVYLDYEIPEHLRKTRLAPLHEQFKALGKDFSDNLAFIDKASDHRLMNIRGEEQNKGSFDRLFHEIQAMQPDVLIVDPFSSTHSMNEISNEIKQPLNNLDRIIDHSGCAVILIHHASSKAKTDSKGRETSRSVREKPRGHSSILDWCDAHLDLSDVSEGNPSVTKTVMTEWGKTRYGRIPERRKILLNFDTMAIESLGRYE